MNAVVKPRLSRNAVLLAAVLGAAMLLAATTTVKAADAAGVKAVQEREQRQREERAAPPPAQAQQAAPAARSGDRQNRGPQPQAGGNVDRGNGDRGYNANRGGRPDYRNANGDRVIVGPPRGTAGRDARILPPSRIQGYRPPPPSRVVQRLPPGYRSYNWRGSSYYNYRGSWYRPYGSSYVIVGAPYGMFVPYLPSYYSSVWFGGSRYYYADDTYYMYEPQRRGYVVTRSPYNDSRDDEEDYDSDSGDSYDEDLYIYPTRGQSEKQQSDDRYECHKWAVDQTHYDPTDSDYKSEDRQQYDRAIAACLTGRGYSVK
ncbi:MAG: DUF6515 family protein [Pseudomonadota bacterium]